MNTDSQRQELPMRVGLFGGTFNPVHRAHHQAAREVLQRFELDRIDFIPCALPPHKRRGPLAPAPDRLEMLRLALEETPQLAISDIEVQRPGPSYTIDTLRHYSAGLSAGGRLFFLVGLDAFLELHTWKAYPRLLDLAALVIMSRPMPGQPHLALRQTAAAYARRHLSDQYRPSGDGYVLRHPNKQPLHLARVTAMDIASSHIRAAISRGAPVGQIDRWVPPAVSRYIDQKGLYR